MAQGRVRKARDSIQDAHELYEEWMEPGWNPTPSPAPSEGPKQAVKPQRSNFKFSQDYLRDVPSRSTTGRSPAPPSRYSSRKPTPVPEEPQQEALSFEVQDLLEEAKKRFKEVDFKKFYGWVTNGRLDDLHLAKTLLFGDSFEEDEADSRRPT
ncbi:hypothetical protein AAVH_04970 [Aphelenchoides avenae]|nr:hypothetical protein AAVH_04970 [Aphelenchus avenae]